MAGHNTCTKITNELIPKNGIIVFDWDNTLKMYDKTTRQISSRVEKSDLQAWKKDKQCEMYIISAINPSKINLETLLFEVTKLGLQDLFTEKEDKIEVHAGKFARKGNIIICGYDKAETFLQVSKVQLGKTSDEALHLSGVPADDIDAKSGVHDSFDGAMPERNVVFFDDEEVNIVNFSSIVKDSKCFLVK